MSQLFEDGSYQSFAALTPADVDVTPFRGLFVGGAGTVVLTGTDGVVATFTCTASQVLPVVGKRVAAASTATGVVALR